MKIEIIFYLHTSLYSISSLQSIFLRYAWIVQVKFLFSSSIRIQKDSYTHISTMFSLSVSPRELVSNIHILNSLCFQGDMKHLHSNLSFTTYLKKTHHQTLFSKYVFLLLGLVWIISIVTHRKKLKAMKNYQVDLLPTHMEGK